MSRIYFTNREGDVEVHGRERHRMAGLCNNVAWGMIDSMFPPFLDKTPDVLSIFQEAYRELFRTVHFRERLKSWLFAPCDNRMNVCGVEVDVFSTILNTAYTIGSDVVRLCARIHAQCEIFGYFEPENREWVCEVIQEALGNGIFDASAGWLKVLEMFKTWSPVVLSYSITDTFPNPYLIGIKEADEVDEFLELPFREQFDDCFFYLRKNSPKLEIKDDPQYRFGQEYDFMHINKMFQ